MGILAGLATVFLSIGGVRYVMGGGDPGEIEKAKTSFKAAGIGYSLARSRRWSWPCSRASWGGGDVHHQTRTPSRIGHDADG
jgi:hypothetical protein